MTLHDHREPVRARILALCESSGLGLPALAVRADVSIDTLISFMVSNAPSRQLSHTAMARIEAAARAET